LDIRLREVIICCENSYREISYPPYFLSSMLEWTVNFIFPAWFLFIKSDMKVRFIFLMVEWRDQLLQGSFVTNLVISSRHHQFRRSRFRTIWNAQISTIIVRICNVAAATFWNDSWTIFSENLCMISKSICLELMSYFSQEEYIPVTSVSHPEENLFRILCSPQTPQKQLLSTWKFNSKMPEFNKFLPKMNLVTTCRSGSPDRQHVKYF
jgi:hypothetical protein